MPSTPSSASSSEASATRKPGRGAVVALLFVSIAIPLAVLAFILTNDSDNETPSSRSGPSGVTGNAAQATDSSKAKVGSTAPGFTLPSTTGATVSLSDLRGHPVVVVFYASWCHPCEEELPVLQELADGDDRLRVVGVSFRDLPSDSVDFIERLGVKFPALLDDQRAPVAKSYGVRGIPQTIFVDAKGIVRGRVFGETSRAALQPAIDDLLAGKDIRSI